MGDEKPREPTLLGSIIDPGPPPNEVTPRRLECDGGWYLPESGKPQKQKGCGQIVQICERHEVVDGKRQLVARYATGLCESCGSREREMRERLRDRQQQSSEESRSTRARGGREYG